MNKDLSASADADRACAPSGLSRDASQAKPLVPSADELGQRCADSISPDLFKPLVKQIVEDIYGRLMNDVQDYLCENIEYNISARIASAEREARRAQEELAELKERYGQLIYSVKRKFEGESRHETALRYIRERENAQGIEARSDETRSGSAEGESPVAESDAP